MAWLDKRPEHVANIIREVQREGNERSPDCEIETPVIFDDAPIPTEAPIEPWWREFADKLAAARAELKEVAT